MSTTQDISRMNPDEDEDEIDVNKKISIYAHRKKQAANDAQLLMNRIALLQKEEERSVKKIEQTKDRALQILSLREENERRMQTLIEATDSRRRLQKQLHKRNISLEEESRKVKEMNQQEIFRRKKEDAAFVQRQKEAMRMEIIKLEQQEQEKKHKQRELIRRQQDEMRRRKEEEKREQERRTHESFLQRAKLEELEAMKAEKLVRSLERKEREWIEKLKNVQVAQETAYEHLETALRSDSVDISPLMTTSASRTYLDSEPNTASRTSPARSGKSSGRRSHSAARAR